LKKLGNGLGLKNGNFEDDLVFEWWWLWELDGGGSWRISSLGKDEISLSFCEVSMGFPWQSPMNNPMRKKSLFLDQLKVRKKKKIKSLKGSIGLWIFKRKD
jgi:hypothetical protein